MFPEVLIFSFLRLATLSIITFILPVKIFVESDCSAKHSPSIKSDVF